MIDPLIIVYDSLKPFAKELLHERRFQECREDLYAAVLLGMHEDAAVSEAGAVAKQSTTTKLPATNKKLASRPSRVLGDSDA
jgi:hypothetical protein